MKERFNRNQLIVMALGNLIGSGIFLGSSTVLMTAGPAAVLAYLFGGIVMVLEVLFLTEMSVINPAPGSFRVHASEIFGPWIGFVNGWMFWCSGILGMASEVAAAAIFSSFWFPHIPLWIFCVVYAAIMFVINLSDLKGLSRIESILASIKVIALAVFIVFGILLLLHIVHPGSVKISDPFTSMQSFMPNGPKGVFASMIMVMFSFVGTGIIGLGIADTKDPAKSAPAAISVITVTVLILYVFSILFLSLLAPLSSLSSDSSPFILLMKQMRIPYSDSILNFIILTAALSGLNSAMYSSSRMLNSLSRDGQGPRIFQKTNKNGVPVYSLGASSAFLILTAILSYFLPKKVFVILATASGFLAMFNWLTISITHYFYRRKTLKENPEKLKFKAFGYPYTSFIEALLILAIFCTAPFYPGQSAGLIGGVILLVALVSAFFILRRLKILGRKN